MPPRQNKIPLTQHEHAEAARGREIDTNTYRESSRSPHTAHLCKQNGLVHSFNLGLITGSNRISQDTLPRKPRRGYQDADSLIQSTRHGISDVQRLLPSRSSDFLCRPAARKRRL